MYHPDGRYLTNLCLLESVTKTFCFVLAFISFFISFGDAVVPVPEHAHLLTTVEHVSSMIPFLPRRRRGLTVR